MALVETLTLGAATVLVSVVAVWLLSLPLRNTGIVDVFWGLGFVVVAWVTFLASDPTSGAGVGLHRQWLVLFLVTLWGLRLAVHIGLRNRGKGEDFRYRAFRERAGRRWWLQSLFTVFVLQGAIMWVVALPVMVVMWQGGDALTWRDYVGVAIWGVGFLFEAVGDGQLARFKADRSNRGKVMDQGLWRYTRHPNYFGDAVQWWGVWVVAWSAPEGWWTFVGPLLMTILLMRVSGVTFMERSLRKSKPGYEAYTRRTNAFFPGPPKG